jgi:nucleoside-diphosphate-sugar epimerase
LNEVRAGSLALIDGGFHPCVLVDVANLCHAIELSINASVRDGKRLFITDSQPISWLDLLSELAPLLPPDAVHRLPGLSSQNLRERLASPARTKPSLRLTVRHLLSSEVRAALRKDPLLARADHTLRNLASLFGESFESRLRDAVEGPSQHTAENRRAPGINLRLSAHQIREVVHSNERARLLLGYRPPYSTAASFAAFRKWYAFQTGREGSHADLFARLKT